MYMEWFFYSLISNTTPNYITFSNDNVTDTLCIADNIADLYLKADTIHIVFDGYPRKYGEEAEVKKDVAGYVVVTEISAREYIQNVRSFYKTTTK